MLLVCTSIRLFYVICLMSGISVSFLYVVCDGVSPSTNKMPTYLCIFPRLRESRLKI